MAALDETTAKRIAKLVRMFGSPSPEEANVALLKLRSLCVQENLSFNDLGTVIENANGEIEALKYSDADMASVANRMRERGRQEGYEKAQTEKELPPEFYDADGTPRWYELAEFTARSMARFKPGFEQEFVESMPSKMLGFGSPRSAKQARYILAFFRRVGGVVPTGIMFCGERIS
jgi:hypothetical protein